MPTICPLTLKERVARAWLLHRSNSLVRTVLKDGLHRVSTHHQKEVRIGVSIDDGIEVAVWFLVIGGAADFVPFKNEQRQSLDP